MAKVFFIRWRFSLLNTLTFLVLSCGLLVCLHILRTCTPLKEKHEFRREDTPRTQRYNTKIRADRDSVFPEEDSLKDMIRITAGRELHALETKLAKAHANAINQETSFQLIESIALLEIIFQKINLLPEQIQQNITKKKQNSGQAVQEPRRLLEVCPEKLLDYDLQWPVRESARVLTNCTNAKPFSSVISILINGIDYKTSQQITDILNDISLFYPGLKVYLALPRDIRLPETLRITVTKVFISENDRSGKIWNTLVNMASTKYVLLAPKLYRFLWFARLERLVRVISLHGVDAVGGAAVTPDGHWVMGCLQTTIRNYTLFYEDGYFRSRSSCAYCDHLISPFVSRKNTLKKIPFDESLTDDVAVYDFFIRLRDNNGISMVCPDSMFYRQDHASIESDKSLWLGVAQKYKLNQIRLTGGIIHRFSCVESGLGCSWVQGTIMPICCLQNLIDSISHLFSLCEEIGMYCRIGDGTVLGAEKFSGILPWERDADIFTIRTTNISLWNHRQKLMDRYGYRLTLIFPEKCRSFDITNNDCHLYRMTIPGWTVEIWSAMNLEMDVNLYKKYNLIPTKMSLGGKWVNGPRNPGLTMYNHFGKEILRHAEHWLDLGIESVGHYQSGKFQIACPEPGKHFCLQKYFADGNIQFKWS